MIGDRYRLEGTYERLRRALLAAPNDGRLDRALSYWVLPTDRRLPIALLDRQVRELLSLPLGDLLETQGVGQKKILGFFDLLRRALHAQSPHAPFGLPKESPEDSLPNKTHLRFDPGTVSEAVWSDWCETIQRSGLAPLMLGRVAVCLRPLPSVIWQKPLGYYATQSLAEIRQLKTHGEKRVNAILGVFASIYEAVSTAALNEHLQIDLAPRFVPTLNRWLIETNSRTQRPLANEWHEHVVRPLLRQIEIDLDDQVALLVAERIGLEGPPPTVQQQADRLKVTRARIYQLLEDCAQVMAVRWPEGRWMLVPKESDHETNPETVALLNSVRSLFFPEEALVANGEIANK